VQLVDEVGDQELGVHLAAALDHQPRHAVGAQVLTDPAHLHRLSTVDRGRSASELREGIVGPLTRAVHKRLGLAEGEEFARILC
jgi:hypothetical protein